MERRESYLIAHKKVDVISMEEGRVPAVSAVLVVPVVMRKQSLGINDGIVIPVAAVLAALFVAA